MTACPSDNPTRLPANPSETLASVVEMVALRKRMLQDLEQFLAFELIDAAPAPQRPAGNSSRGAQRVPTIRVEQPEQ